MSSEANVCPILSEFAGMPGFPIVVEVEEQHWRVHYREEAFKTNLDTVTRAAARETLETGTPISAAFCRHLSAILALSTYPYTPAKPPEPEPAPPADPVDELDTPPAREEEIR